jgi:hypothetical protein
MYAAYESNKPCLINSMPTSSSISLKKSSKLVNYSFWYVCSDMCGMLIPHELVCPLKVMGESQQSVIFLASLIHKGCYPFPNR